MTETPSIYTAPHEVVLHFFGYLTDEEVGRVACANRTMLGEVGDPAFIRGRIKDRLGYVPEALAKLQQETAARAVMQAAAPFFGARAKYPPGIAFGCDRDAYNRLVKWEPVAIGACVVGAVAFVPSAGFIILVGRFGDVLALLAKLQYSQHTLLRIIGRVANWGWHGIWISAIGGIAGIGLMAAGVKGIEFIESRKPGKDYWGLKFNVLSFSQLNTRVDWTKVWREALLPSETVARALFLSHELKKSPPPLTSENANTEFALIRTANAQK